MRVYECYRVSSRPKKRGCRSVEFRLYDNSLYNEAECIVESREDACELADDEFDQLVEETLDGIIDTLRTYGRYPKTGEPLYVAFE